MKLTDDVKQRKQKHFKQYRTAKQKLANKENLVRFLHRGKPNQAKSNYKDCSFGNWDSFVKGKRLSVLILAKSQAGQKFEVLEVPCLVSIYNLY